MKRFLAAFALFMFCIATACFASMHGRRDIWPQYTLLKMVEDHDLVVTGEVTSMVPAFGKGMQTDVSIDVETVVKGELGAGETTVTCTILGGDGVNPATGERVILNVTPEAEFEVGENIMLFLRVKDDSIGLPHPDGGYYVAHSGYGKRPVEDEMTAFLYTVIDDADDAKGVELPLDGAVKLGKASVKDAAVLLEDRIKARVGSNATDLISLSSSLVDDLKRDAQRIIDKPERPKTTK